MRKWTNLHNFRRQLFALSAVACAGLAVVSVAIADSGAGLAPTTTSGGDVGNGIVKGQHSNVRSRPSVNSEVIAQLHKGESVDVLERKTASEREKVMDWLRIALPPTAKCFVNAKHLTDGTVNVDNLNVHCGPGSSYRGNVLASWRRRARVEVVTKKGEWVQIRPTPECSGWIAAELVDVQPAPRAPAPPVNTTENGSEIVTPPVAVSSAPAAPPVSIINTDPDVLVTYVVKDGYVGAVSEALQCAGEF